MPYTVTVVEQDTVEDGTLVRLHVTDGTNTYSWSAVVPSATAGVQAYLDSKGAQFFRQAAAKKQPMSAEEAQVETGDGQLKQRATALRDMRTSSTMAWSIAVANAIRSRVGTDGDLLDAGGSMNNIDVDAAYTAIRNAVENATSDPVINARWANRVLVIYAYTHQTDVLSALDFTKMANKKGYIHAAMLMSMITGTEAGLSKSLGGD